MIKLVYKFVSYFDSFFKFCFISEFQPDATMYDVILAIRADEAHHRVVNHTLASLKEDEYNPYKPGK